MIQFQQNAREKKDKLKALHKLCLQQDSPLANQPFLKILVEPRLCCICD